MIAVKPIDDFQRTVDRLEVALLKPVEELEDHLLEPGDLQPGEVVGRRDPAVAQLLTQDASVRFRLSRSAAPISSTPAPAMSEARIRWARVTLERFDPVDRVVWVMGASEADGPRRRTTRRFRRAP